MRERGQLAASIKRRVQRFGGALARLLLVGLVPRQVALVDVRTTGKGGLRQVRVVSTPPERLPEGLLIHEGFPFPDPVGSEQHGPRSSQVATSRLVRRCFDRSRMALRLSWLRWPPRGSCAGVSTTKNDRPHSPPLRGVATSRLVRRCFDRSCCG